MANYPAAVPWGHCVAVSAPPGGGEMEAKGGERRMEYSDEQLKALIEEIDELQDIEVTEWEADFIDTILSFSRNRALSPKQRECIVQMQAKYLH